MPHRAAPILEQLEVLAFVRRGQDDQPLLVGDVVECLEVSRQSASTVDEYGFRTWVGRRRSQGQVLGYACRGNQRFADDLIGIAGV